MKQWLSWLVLFALGLVTGWWLSQPDPPEPASVSLGALPKPAALVAHSAEFEPEIIEVTEGVWVAVGYGLANAILVEGPEGAVVIDTLESVDAAEPVARAFAEFTDRPLKAIVYTHNHVDHIFGASAFVEALGAGEDLQVIAQKGINPAIDRIITLYRPIISRRSMRMFGVYLDDQGLINAGIGPRLGIREDVRFGLIRPTRTFADRLDLELAGLRFVLVHAPGETDDQLLVWLPERGVLFPGDNLYRTFPNLYTIRGTPYRDPLAWIDSLDRMRAFEPEHLVPSHTRPLSGADLIRDTLTTYRDGIQFAHDQTVRMINQGLGPDAIAERIRLPEALAGSPFLQEFYGTAQWSARSIFAGNLGWFDGNPTHLRPLPEAEQARRWADLAGGAEALVSAAESAVAAGQGQWALHLTDVLLDLDVGVDRVHALRAQALQQRGGVESNPNARHYYLTRAAELSGLEIPDRVGRPSDAMLRDFPLDRYFRALATNLHAEAVDGTDQVVTFEFTDVAEIWSVHIRNGIADTMPVDHPDAAFRVRADSLVFKQLLAGLRNPALTLTTEFDVEGGTTIDLMQWMALFQPGQ